MIYADYAYYTEKYLGNAIPEEDYPRVAARASRYIDYLTQDRAEDNADLKAVKLCCCALAEQYQLIDAAQRASADSVSGKADQIKSESVGSWSRTYGSAADNAAAIAEFAQNELQKLAYSYLSITGLLYRGRRCK